MQRLRFEVCVKTWRRLEEARDNVREYSGQTVDTQDKRVIQMQVVKNACTRMYTYSYRTNADRRRRMQETRRVDDV